MSNKQVEEKLRNESRLFKKGRIVAFGLFLIFAMLYFATVIVTSEPLKHIATLTVLGLPLAVLAGWALFIAGIVITRIYLVMHLRLMNGDK